MFCRNTSGRPRWQHSSMKCAPFSADSRVQHAVVGDDADRIAVEAREARHQCRAVARLELVEVAPVDDARDHLAHVVGLADVGVDDAVELVGGIARRDADRRPPASPASAGSSLPTIAPRDRERVVVVQREVVGHAGNARVHVGAAQFLGGRRSRRSRPSPAADRRERSLPCSRTMIDSSDIAGTYAPPAVHEPMHDGDLRDAFGRHRRLVVEDAAEVVAIGKHVGLVRQVRAARVDEVDARQPVLARDLLRPQCASSP